MQPRATLVSWAQGVLIVLCTFPALDLWRVLASMNRDFIRAYDYRVLSLGIAASGAWAFIFLFCALACTPVQTVTGFRWPGELRRILGLAAFGYACLHVLVYVVIGQKLNFAYVLADTLNQHSRVPGWLALLALAPLAITSTDAMIRRLGAKRWKRLHRLVYLATALAILHLAWTELDDHTGFERTKLACLPFLVLMLLRVLPLSAWRKKLRA